MLILVDDVKFDSEDMFFNYIDTMFPDDSITDEASLVKVFTEGEPEIEFILSDYKEIKEESKAFAENILTLLKGINESNKNYKLTLINT